MKKSFVNLHKDEIIYVIDSIFSNVAGLFPPELSPEPGWGYRDEGDLCLVKTDPPSEFPNWICATRFTADNADRRINETIAQIRAGSCPPIWTVGPLSEPHDLGARLQAAGLQKIVSFPGMAFDVESLDRTALSDSPLRLPAGSVLEIREVGDNEEFTDWVRVNIAGFHEYFHGTGCEESVYRNLFARTSEPFIRFYGAFLDGRMVGAAQAVFYPATFSCKLVELHQCSVIPECRKMGIARCLVTRPLIDAQAEGYVLSTIFAAPAAADPFWLSIGYRKYCDLDWYMLA